MAREQCDINTANQLEISTLKVVLLCKFSLYRAVRAPIVARTLRLQPHVQPHGWSGPESGRWGKGLWWKGFTKEPMTQQQYRQETQTSNCRSLICTRMTSSAIGNEAVSENGYWQTGTAQSPEVDQWAGKTMRVRRTEKSAMGRQPVDECSQRRPYILTT